MDRNRIMNYKPFDTHKYIKSLQETGFNEQQAEVLVKSLLESKDFDLSFLATREQIVQLDNKIDSYRKDTKTEIDSFRKDTKTEIDSFRKDTKAEFDSLKKDIKLEMSEHKQSITAEMSKNKTEILKWVIGLFVVLVITILIRPYLG